MSRNVAGGEDRVSHPDVGGEVSVCLSELDGSSYGGERGDDRENQIRSRWEPIAAGHMAVRAHVEAERVRHACLDRRRRIKQGILL